MAGSVKVQLASIKKAWRDSPSREAWVALRTNDGTLESFWDALDATNHRLVERYGAELPVEAAGLTVVPGGYATQVGADELRPELLDEWAILVVPELEVRGFTGTLGGAKYQNPPDWTVLGPPCLTVFVAYGMDLAARALDPESGNWHVPHAATDQIVRFAADWAQLPDARVFLTQQVFSFEAAPDTEVATPLLNAVQSVSSASVTYVDEPHRHATRAWVGANSRGVFNVVGDPPPNNSAADGWVRRVDALCEVVRAVPEHADLAVLRIAYPLASVWGDLGQFQPLPDGETGSRLEDRADLFASYVPDAHGVQLLTGRHLERARNLSTWQITDLGRDRYLVEAPDLAPWYAQELPDPAVLAQARADFGDMILTVQTIKENPVTWTPSI
ncbi:hypothetical protein [Nocardioides speluncae]|uniref:hypothetical protein n=1 Tax=Nocardioides speluncae TaxID=2670337 RepID=UPI000D69B14C|nr:hypothetical protein [Nocardioides speluncae]